MPAPLPEPKNLRWKQTFRALKHSWRRIDRIKLREHRIGSLIDLFAAVSQSDHQITRQEIEAALDFLRASFPEAGPDWISKRFLTSMRKRKSVTEAAQIVKRDFTADERRLVLLELLILVQNSGGENIADILFNVGFAFDEAACAKGLLSFETAAPEETPGIEQLHLGGDFPDVLLGPEHDSFAVLICRANRKLWVQNRAESPIRARGRMIPKFQWLRLGPNHELWFGELRYSAAELDFLFDYKQNAKARVLFLSSEDGMLNADRNRSRDSFARLEFGLRARLEILSASSIVHSGRVLRRGEQIELDDHENIQIDDLGNFPIRELRRRAMELGRHFEFPKNISKIIVTNDRDTTNPVSLRISPDLAGRLTLVFNFSRNSAIGEIEVIENEAKATLNGRVLTGGEEIRDGDLIRLSPTQALRCRLSANIIEEEKTLIQNLKINDLTHYFINHNEPALSGVSFSLNRGEMLAILGPSGCGKSTLLSILAGHQRPSFGTVRLNGLSLYNNINRCRPFIAQLPHEQALNPKLSVREHLELALIIREPSLNFSTRKARIDLALTALDLQHRSRHLVGRPGEKVLSAGERTRLNLGQDLVGSADLFLLDEPIAGLSSKDAEHVVDNLRQLSREKLVIATLHRPNAPILKHFDKVLVLDYGGHMAFYGPPDQALLYFSEAGTELGYQSPNQGETADLIFDVLESAHFYEGPERRRSSTFWQERFSSLDLLAQINESSVPSRTQLGGMGKAEDSLPLPKPPRRKFADHLRLLGAQLRRDFTSNWRNKPRWINSILQPMILALLIAGILRSSPTSNYDFFTALHLPAFLFLSSVVAMFFGLTIAATDILNDFPFLRRERNYRPSLCAYLSAKLVYFSFFCGLENAIFLWIGANILDFPYTYWHHWPILLMTSLVGSGMSMLTSLLLNSQNASLGAVPLLLVPQVLLAGALVPFEEMNHIVPLSRSNLDLQGKPSAGNVPFLAQAMPLRYTFESLVLREATHNPFNQTEEKLKTIRDQDLSAGNDGEAPKLALRALFSLNDSSRDNAQKSLKTLVKASQQNNTPRIEALHRDKSSAPRPIDQFFTNSRLADLYQRAEIQRLDSTMPKNRSIFLARVQPFGLKTIPTFYRNACLLSFFTIFCWIVSGLLLYRTREKP